MLLTTLKYKKALTAILKENLSFKQLLLNYINSQKKQTKKERLRLVISSIRVDVVAKTDDEVYVSSILCQRRSSCWKYRKWCTYFENRYHHAKMTEKKTINFPVSPYCTLLFSRKEYIKFSEVVLVAVHCIPNQLPCDCLNPGLEILPILQRIFICFWKTAIKTMNLLSSVLEQLTVVLLVSF